MRSATSRPVAINVDDVLTFLCAANFEKRVVRFVNRPSDFVPSSGRQTITIVRVLPSIGTRNLFEKVVGRRKRTKPLITAKISRRRANRNGHIYPGEFIKLDANSLFLSKFTRNALDNSKCFLARRRIIRLYNFRVTRRENCSLEMIVRGLI